MYLTEKATEKESISEGQQPTLIFEAKTNIDAESDESGSTDDIDLVGELLQFRSGFKTFQANLSRSHFWSCPKRCVNAQCENFSSKIGVL